MVGSFGEEREVGKEESARCPFNRFFFLGKSASASSVRKRRKSIFSPRSACFFCFFFRLARGRESLSLSGPRGGAGRERTNRFFWGKNEKFGVERVEDKGLWLTFDDEKVREMHLI